MCVGVCVCVGDEAAAGLETAERSGVNLKLTDFIYIEPPKASESRQPRSLSFMFFQVLVHFSNPLIRQLNDKFRESSRIPDCLFGVFLTTMKRATFCEGHFISVDSSKVD